jgi:hypothetical protein
MHMHFRRMGLLAPMPLSAKISEQTFGQLQYPYLELVAISAFPLNFRPPTRAVDYKAKWQGDP